MTNVIITRHPALIQVLKEDFDIDGKVIDQASVDDVKGKHVYGILPLHLACEADKITTVNIITPLNLRGVELTVDQVREYMSSDLTTYKVSKIKS